MFSSDLDEVREYLASLASGASNALHLRLERASQGCCLFLFSPELRQLSGESAYEDELMARPKTMIALPRTSFPEESAWPCLVPLDTSLAADSSLLVQSIEEGLDELNPHLIRQGSGRRNAGWLVTQASTTQVAAHLSSLLIQRNANGQRLYLRLTDPAVLWAIWPVLTPDQQAFVMGPIKAWWLLDPAGNLVELPQPSPHGVPGRFTLSPQQWADIERIQPLNRAINIHLTERDVPCALSATEMAALVSRGLVAMRHARLQTPDDHHDDADVALQAMVGAATH